MFKNAKTRKSKIRVLNKKDKALGKKWGDVLLEPTRVYTQTILPLIKKNVKITGIAHITGGGLIRNIKRILPDGCWADVYASEWEIPAIFRRLQEMGNVKEKEMYKVFNMGIGMVIVVRPDEEKRILEYFRKKKETVFSIGIVKKGDRGVVIN